MDTLLLDKIERIEKKLDLLLGDRSGETWVKASAVTSRMKWNNKRLLQARERGEIQWKYVKVKNVKGERVNVIRYLLQSLNPISI